MNLSLRQLKLFESISRLQSLTAAAEEQAISQSAASQSLKELERQLGYALFSKTGRSLRITEAGQLALPKVRQVLSTIESLQYPQASFIGGKLRVSASETIASYLMPKLLADFVKEYPLVEPELDIQNTEGVVQEVTIGKASIGFIEGPTSSPDVTLTQWRADYLKVFSSPEHYWALVNNQIPASELKSLPWIVRELGSGTRAVFDQAFIQRHEAPLVKLALTRQEAIKQSVRAGLGIGCLSELSISDELKSNLLVELKSELELKRTFSIVCLKSVQLTPLVERFAAFAHSWKT